VAPGDAAEFGVVAHVSLLGTGGDGTTSRRGALRREHAKPQKNEAAPAPGEWFRPLPWGTRLATFCSVPRPFRLVAFATAAALAAAAALASACGQETPSTVT